MRPRLASRCPRRARYVLDIEGRRVNVYERDGTPAETWSVPTPAYCGWPMYPRGEGTLWMPVEEVDRDTRERRYGVQAYGAEGPLGDVLWVPDIGFEAITYTFGDRELTVPLGPRLAWGPTPSGGVFVARSRGETTVFPCWEPESIIDAFDASGRYLGEVEVPEVMAAWPLLLHVDGELVVTGAQNDVGVYEVKRYRLVVPN